jgi:hypothetical protein
MQEGFGWRERLLTLGLEPPAKPALVVAVPTSITMGWLRRADAAPEAPLLTWSSVLMVKQISKPFDVWRWTLDRQIRADTPFSSPTPYTCLVCPIARVWSFQTITTFSEWEWTKMPKCQNARPIDDRSHHVQRNPDDLIELLYSKLSTNYWNSARCAELMPSSSNEFNPSDLESYNCRRSCIFPTREWISIHCNWN